jgi:hypothetical protein
MLAPRHTAIVGARAVPCLGHGTALLFRRLRRLVASARLGAPGGAAKPRSLVPGPDASARQLRQVGRKCAAENGDVAMVTLRQLRPD